MDPTVMAQIGTMTIACLTTFGVVGIIALIVFAIVTLIE